MIYIYKDALEKIEIEVKASGNNETGGILLGFYFEDNDFLITHALDAGPKAVKTPIFFRKDYKYSLSIQKRYFKKYSVDYIGEWHKHPNDNTSYSILDYIAMLYISMINQNPCIFSIVGSSFSSNNCDLPPFRYPFLT